MSGRWAVVALGIWALLWSAPARGQHLRVFELEDFVAPSLLQLLGEGEEAKAYAALSLVTGAGRDLQRWGEVTKGDFRLAHLAADFYSGNWQLGVDALNLSSGEDTARFGDRLGLQVGRYSISDTFVELDEENQRQDLYRYVHRTLVTWHAERQPQGGLGHSVTVDLDVRRDGPSSSLVDVIGGYSYSWVKAGEGDNGHDRHYLSLDFRSPVAAAKNGARLVTGFGVGVEHVRGHFQWGAVRYEISGDLPIRPLQSRLIISWAPAYQLDRGELQQEVAVLFVPPLVSRIFSAPRARR